MAAGVRKGGWGLESDRDRAVNLSREARKRNAVPQPQNLMSKRRDVREAITWLEESVLLTAGLDDAVIRVLERQHGRAVRVRVTGYDTVIGLPEWLQDAIGEH